MPGPATTWLTGLGTPNGVLLGRALTAIAHSQISFDSRPDVIDSDGHGGWTSGADQSLLFQTMSDHVTQVGVDLGPDAFGFFSTASASFAWTSRMAEQSLQADFDPALVVMFDKQAQGGLGAGARVDGRGAGGVDRFRLHSRDPSDLEQPVRLCDFLSGDGAVRVARPVAVAETADAHNDQTAIVRLRQGGQDDLSITFYRVDDLSGTINGLHPGDAATSGGAGPRLSDDSGGTSINGPGYGNYEQTGSAT